mgnify:CR=1 FL=1
MLCTSNNSHSPQCSTPWQIGRWVALLALIAATEPALAEWSLEAAATGAVADDGSETTGSITPEFQFELETPWVDWTSAANVAVTSPLDEWQPTTPWQAENDIVWTSSDEVLSVALEHQHTEDEVDFSQARTIDDRVATLVALQRRQGQRLIHRLEAEWDWQNNRQVDDDLVLSEVEDQDWQAGYAPAFQQSRQTLWQAETRFQERESGLSEWRYGLGWQYQTQVNTWSLNGQWIEASREQQELETYSLSVRWQRETDLGLWQAQLARSVDDTLSSQTIGNQNTAVDQQALAITRQFTLSLSDVQWQPDLTVSALLELGDQEQELTLAGSNIADDRERTARVELGFEYQASQRSTTTLDTSYQWLEESLWQTNLGWTRVLSPRWQSQAEVQYTESETDEEWQWLIGLRVQLIDAGQ